MQLVRGRHSINPYHLANFGDQKMEQLRIE